MLSKACMSPAVPIFRLSRLTASLLGAIFIGQTHAGVTYAYDFNDNRLPTGWAGDLVARNGRLEVGTSGHANYNIIGQRSTFRDMNLSMDVHLGVGSSYAFLGAVTTELVQTPLSQQVFHSLGLQSNGRDQVSADGYTGCCNQDTFRDLSTHAQLGAGTFHATMAVKSGVVQSITLTDKATGQTYVPTTSSGSYVPPQQQKLGSFHIDLAGSGSWIDNVTVATLPKKFGLFVGVNDSQGSAYTFGGFKEAGLLADAFVKQGYSAAVLGHDVASNPQKLITRDNIVSALSSFKQRGIEAGDTVVLSISGHGGSLRDPYGNGIDIVGLGGTNGQYLTDYQLAEAIHAFDPDALYKWQVFMDACNSGGFWSEDISERLNLDGAFHLADLSNIHFFAASPEGLKTSFDPASGLGIFGMALIDAVGEGQLDLLGGAQLSTWLQNRGQMLANGFSARDPNYVFYEAAFGDPISAREYSADYVFQTSSVDAPGTAALMLLGLSLMVVRRCRRPPAA